MEAYQRELQVARILSGRTRLTVRKENYVVRSPTGEDRYVAAEIYSNTRAEAIFEGVLTESEMLDLLIENQIWKESDALEKTKLEKAVEDLKVGLFENRLKSNARQEIKRTLRETRTELARLTNIRHGLDFLTADGLAVSARYRYLVSSCLFCESGSKYDGPDGIIDKVMEALVYHRLEESEYRELSRNDPWRSVWSAKLNCGRGLFDRPATESSDEQARLMMWSSVYDNIRDHPNCPGDDIVDDDDCLDGWMTLQRRKREKDMISQQAESLGSEKTKNADEQFIMVDTIEDAKKVESMNTDAGAFAKRERMVALKKKGEINELDMPDTAREVTMGFNKLEQARMRQGK